MKIKKNFFFFSLKHGKNLNFLPDYFSFFLFLSFFQEHFRQLALGTVLRKYHSFVGGQQKVLPCAWTPFFLVSAGVFFFFFFFGREPSLMTRRARVCLFLATNHARMRHVAT